jgi:hypothetical protein
MDAENFAGVLGYCDIVSATSIQGWAFDPRVPNEPLVMQILVDGSYICSVTCDLERKDVTDAGYSSRRAGFHAKIPTELQNDRDHMLEFRGLDGSLISLQDFVGPRQIWVLPKADGLDTPIDLRDVILGSLDPILEGEVRGWAYDKFASDVPVSLDIFIDDVFLKSVRCDVERGDVVTAGHPNARVGLITQLPAGISTGVRMPWRSVRREVTYGGSRLPREKVLRGRSLVFRRWLSSDRWTDSTTAQLAVGFFCGTAAQASAAAAFRFW